MLFFEILCPTQLVCPSFFETSPDKQRDLLKCLNSSDRQLKNFKDFPGNSPKLPRTCSTFHAVKQPKLILAVHYVERLVIHLVPAFIPFMVIRLDSLERLRKFPLFRGYSLGSLFANLVI